METNSAESLKIQVSPTTPSPEEIYLKENRVNKHTADSKQVIKELKNV